MMNPSDWPIDPSTLRKGDVIGEKELTAMVGLRPGHPAFDHGVLQVRNEIDRQLRDLGRTWTFEREGNTLLVLSDADATLYLERRARSARALLRRSLRQLNGVDQANLTRQQRIDHERRAMLVGAYVAAGDEAQRHAIGKISYHQRNTPGLLAIGPGD